MSIYSVAGVRGAGAAGVLIQKRLTAQLGYRHGALKRFSETLRGTKNANDSNYQRPSYAESFCSARYRSWCSRH
jgi:hypothetical protein